MKPISCHFRPLADCFFVGFGLWTIFCNLFAITGRSFADLLLWSPIPAVLAIGFLVYRHRTNVSKPRNDVQGQGDGPTPTKRQAPWILSLCVAAALACLYFATGSFLLWWLLSLGFLVRLLKAPAPSPGMGPAAPARGDASWLLLALLVAVPLSSFFWLKPNFESSFYLSIGVSSAEHPARPLLRSDWLHGEPGLHPLGFYYLVHSYELLVAALSDLAGISQAALMYQIFPRIWLFLMVIVYWLALRQLGLDHRAAAVGVLIAAVVWITWGGPPRTLGGRLFNGFVNGKNLLITIGVPALVYYCLRYRERANIFNWLVCACAQVSAVGLSSSGMVVGPLTAACVFLSRLEMKKCSLLKTAWGCVPTIYIALLGLAIRATEVGSLGSTDRGGLVHSSERGLQVWLGGEGRRLHLALFFLLALAVVPSRSGFPHRRTVTLVASTILLVVNPITAAALNTVVGNMWWRTFWSVPFPLLLGLLGANLLAARYNVSRVAWNLVIFWLAALLFVGSPHTWALKSVKAPWHSGRAYYVDRHYEAAEAVVRHLGPQDLLMAPTRVAMSLIAFEKHPRLVAVRSFYSPRILAPLGGAEVAARIRVLSLMDGIEAQSETGEEQPDDVFLAKELSRLGVSGVVLDGEEGSHRFAPVLHDMGFEVVARIRGYSLWTQPSGSSR